MTLQEIATITGKGGLFKILAPTKSGVILESMDEAKTKLVGTTNHRLSLLNEISIYTTTKEGTVPLEMVLRKIHKEFGDDLGVDGNSDASELKAFLKSILPDYDDDRVYVSDIKKLVKWYEILSKYAPEILKEEEKKTVAKAEEKVATETEEPTSKEPETKTSAKKKKKAEDA